MSAFRSILNPVFLALIAALVGCGGGGGSNPPADACKGDCAVTDTGVPPDPGTQPDSAEPDVFDPGTTPFDEGPQAEEVTETSDCPGAFGCACQTNDQCDDGFCVIVDDSTGERKCTRVCVEDCPQGFGCQQVSMGSDVMFLCMVQIDPLCHLKCAPGATCGAGTLSCLKDGDCGLDNLCVKMETSQFCLRACGEGTGHPECPDGYECKLATNLEGTVTRDQCVPKSGHCLCPADTDYQAEVHHCGTCETDCKYDNATAACKSGTCKMTGCLGDWFDLKNGDKDGCEYHCTYEGPDDDPDPTYTDANCDGIDGNVKEAVFVDGAKGEDEDNTIGDRSHPFKTMTAAIAFAASQQPKKEVYVSKGQYHEQVSLVSGVSVYGGFDAVKDWKRDVEANKTMILWDNPEPLAVRTILAEQITDKTVFDGFQVKTSSGGTDSRSSYGMWVYQSNSGLQISNNRIEAGNGADGKNGGNGQGGLNGQGGGNGSNGFEYDGWGLFCEKNDSSMNQPGKGGPSPCGNEGGKGGGGGKSGSSGANGEAGAGGGGAGGSGGGKTNNGADAKSGSPGEKGKDGAAGIAAGTLSPTNLFVPGNGGDGADGIHGKGGGGGGGGGGDESCCCDTNGAAGGGGGGGGCGGTAGKGGTGGGGSFALFVVESSPVVKGNVLVSQNGGMGGAGGPGGSGGEGGPGGSGGKKTKDNDGNGGSGAGGGKGGEGGGGGGGGGGPTFGIYIVGASADPKCESNQFELNGFAGSGGQGGGVNDKGETGKSGSVYGPTPSCPAP
jgi:hypothetical protein